MTECERIIKEGILPKSFFKEEVMCDFLVTEERKKIWAIELDLVYKFDLFCKKYGLHYFLISGSLLGAIRHKGFIPWDDDMDIALPREDYDKMLCLASEYFKDPYFFQTIDTDSEFCYVHARLRNSNTTAIDRPFSFQNYNHGIFIDIHPLDGFIPENDTSFYLQCGQICIDNSTYMKRSNPNPTEKDIERINNYRGNNPKYNYDLLNSYGRQPEHCNTEFVIRYTATLYGVKRNQHYRSDYKETISWMFNGIELQIPIGYMHILESMYGEWNEFPPISKRGNWHGNITFNPDVSYKEMIQSYRMNIMKEKESTKSMIIGYTTGVYDLFHIGHLNLLKNAKGMCDYLVVGVTTDELVSYKGTNSVIPFEERIEIVRSCRYVDAVVPQYDMDKLTACKKLGAKVLFVGDDWYGTEKWRDYETQFNNEGIRIVYFPYTRSISSTMLKEKLKNV